MFTRILIILSVLFYSSAAIAQSSPLGSMEGFYSKSKNRYVSTTRPGVYESQSRYALTGGSFVWRAEQENATILNTQLPSINAGCGGIDIYAGSFSFINGDQLEGLLRAIIQDAAGYAFKLAIKEISPQIGAELENMLDVIKDINGQNINSCEAATAIVDNAIEVVNGAKSVRCAVTGAASGIFPDTLGGRACGGDDGKSKESTDMAEATGAAVPMGPESGNLAMQAADKIGGMSDLALKEFYMSITGTLVISDGDPPEFIYIPPIGLDDSVAAAIMRGGTVRGHRCLSFDGEPREKCLAVEQKTNDIVIPASEGYLVRVENILSSLYDKETGISSAAHTAQEIAFIEDTSVPVLAAARIFSQSNPGVGRQMLLSYSELIAFDMALQYLENVSRAILEAGANNPQANNAQLNEWREGVRSNVAHLVKLQSELQLRYKNVQIIIARLNELQSTINAKTNAKILRAATGSQVR